MEVQWFSWSTGITAQRRCESTRNDLGPLDKVPEATCHRDVRYGGHAYGHDHGTSRARWDKWRPETIACQILNDGDADHDDDDDDDDDDDGERERERERMTPLADRSPENPP